MSFIEDVKELFKILPENGQAELLNLAEEIEALKMKLAIKYLGMEETLRN